MLVWSFYDFEILGYVALLAYNEQGLAAVAVFIVTSARQPKPIKN
jgi:hypothetical protein